MGSKEENHLSRLAMPKTWKIAKKTNKWIILPNPGAHPRNMGFPLTLILRDMLGYAKTAKETRAILRNQEVLVDGIRRKDTHFIVGVMDVIEIPAVKKYFRVLISTKGHLALFETDAADAKIKPCKVKGKSQLGKKIQLNLYDGKNIIVDKSEQKVGDSVLLEIPSKKIKETLKLEKGSNIFLLGGSNIGKTGIVEDIKGKKIVFKLGEESAETLKKYAFVIGKGKSAIKIP